jgi:hypothetical protein
MARTRQLAKRWVSQVPGLGSAAIAAYQELKLLRHSKSIARQNVGLPDSETVYWIDPQRIQFHTNFQNTGENKLPADCVFHPVHDKGKVVDGDWDTSQFRFHDLEIYQAIEGVILRDQKWEETTFYQNLLAGLGKSDNPWNIDDRESLDARCRYIDDLISSIRQNGYQQAHEIVLPGEEHSIKKDEKFGSEVSVNIGRNGQYLFQDGRHRLAIAQILKLDKIPVKVLVRHRQWVEFRSFLRTLASDGGGAGRHEKLYQQPVHPDLSDMPVMHQCIDRFEAIQKHLDNSTGHMMEIGANLAYFCHRFEDLGFECIAVEYLPQIALAASRIRDAEEKNFQIIQMDIFAATEKHRLNQKRFKAILALNIFHHFLKYPESYQKLKSWLNGIQVDQLFFETHCSSEDQMEDAYRNYDEAEFNEFIIANSELNQSKLIHRCDDGRGLYKLWK